MLTEITTPALRTIQLPTSSDPRFAAMYTRCAEHVGMRWTMKTTKPLFCAERYDIILTGTPAQFADLHALVTKVTPVVQAL